MSAIITLLTDFGTVDGYVAEMKGVLLAQVPEVRLVDLTHDIPPGDIRAGAYALGRAWRTFPPGTVHLAVVDPAVVSKRECVHPEPESRTQRRTAEIVGEGGHDEQGAVTRAGTKAPRSPVQAERASRVRFYSS